jgi:carboxylate-amine ligase
VNSPFWQGRDTRYAGYRTQVWARWPAAGPVEVHGSPEGYDALVDRLLGTGALLDRGMVYFDARLSEKYPTVEVRVADVAQDVRHSVLVAGLTRALVDTAVAEWQDGRPPPDTSAVVLRAATWRASRFGLGEDLVHPMTDQLAPADRVVADLVDFVAPALTANGDRDLVGEAVERVLSDGTGADQQRRAHARRGSLGDVVRSAVEATQQPS